MRQSRRTTGLYAATAAAALLGAAAISWQFTRAQEAWRSGILALAALQQATRLHGSHAAALKSHLLALAARSLGTSPAQGIASLQQAALTRLQQLAVNGLPGVTAAEDLVVAILVAALIALLWHFWHLGDRQALERLHLQHQLEDLHALLLSSATDGSQLKRVIERLLQYAVDSHGLRHAFVLRWHRERADDSLELYGFAGRTPPPFWKPVPGIFVDGALSGVGLALETRQPWRSGQPPAAPVPILPGFHWGSGQVQPVLVGDEPFGVLVALGSSDDDASVQHFTLAAIARQIGHLIHQAELQADADRVRRYEEQARTSAQILAQLSHELRTPLGLVKGYAATLAHSYAALSPAERDEFLTTLLQETDHLQDRVDHLLRMSAWDAAGVALHPGYIDVASWFDDMALRFPPATRPRIRWSAPSGLGLWGDAEQLRDMLANVIQNALKYTSGPVEIGARAGDSGIVLTVRDYGPGVSDRDLARIFDRFYRGARRAPSPVGGMGLGLSIARAVVQAHHGTIRAENAPAGGLVVTVELPMAAVPETRAEIR